MKKRELEDYKLKAAANLDIELPKFNGTDHKIDIYSFQTKFEEEHMKYKNEKTNREPENSGKTSELVAMLVQSHHMMFVGRS